MTEIFDIKVVIDAATKKKYVSPEIEVVNLDMQPQLLSGSGYTGGAKFKGVKDEDI